MALILKRNGAPLSGALFVTNPRHRRRKLKMNRAKRRSLKFRTLGGLMARANGKRRRRRASKSGFSKFLAKLKRRVGMRRNAGYMINRRHRKHGRKSKLLAFLKNRRRLGMKRNAGYLLNRKHSRKHSRKHLRKNAGYLLNRRRRASKKSGGGAFSLKLLAPVKRLVSKVPLVGSPVASSLGYLAFGAGALATHYYGMKAVRWAAGYLPGQVRSLGKYVAPVGYSLLGVTANVALRKLPIPTVGPITPQLRANLGNAAMIVGAAIDLWRFFHKESQNLSGDDYGDEYGDGGAYDVVGLGGIAEGLGGIGMGDAGDYGDAEMADAYYSGADLNVFEGQAALQGPDSYRAAFGPPPKVIARRQSMLSAHAGRQGHRWGWLIKLVGWDRFKQIAAMEPEERCALIASLKSQAIATVQAQIAQSQAKSQSMSGIGLSGIGMGGIGMGGIGLSGIGESGVADYGVMMAGSAY